MLSKTLNSPPKVGGVPSKRGRWYYFLGQYPLRCARPPTLGGQSRDLDNSYIITKNKVSCRDARYAWYYYYGDRYLSVQTGLYFPFNV